MAKAIAIGEPGLVANYANLQRSRPLGLLKGQFKVEHHHFFGEHSPHRKPFAVECAGAWVGPEALKRNGVFTERTRRA